MSDDDDLGCIGCGGLPARLDAHDLLWCAECIHRKTLLEWGVRHGYPALTSTMEADSGYEGEWAVAIAEGAFLWMNAAVWGKDEYVYALLAVTDTYEKEQSLQREESYVK